MQSLDTTSNDYLNHEAWPTWGSLFQDCRGVSRYATPEPTRFRGWRVRGRKMLLLEMKHVDHERASGLLYSTWKAPTDWAEVWTFE